MLVQLPYFCYVVDLTTFTGLSPPFHFGLRRGILNYAYLKRIGKGSTINNYVSVLRTVRQGRLRYQNGVEYAKVGASFLQKIFIVDFETERRSGQNLLLCPAEVTCSGWQS